MRFREPVSKAAARAERYAGEAKERLAEGGEKTWKETRGCVMRHPMAAVGAALLGGFLIGVMLGWRDSD